MNEYKARNLARKNQIAGLFVNQEDYFFMTAPTGHTVWQFPQCRQ